MKDRRRSAAVIIAVGLYLGVGVALWMLPKWLVPAPALNESTWLAAWTMPLLLVVPIAAVASLFLFRRRRPGAVPIGLGVYLLGVGAAMVLGLEVFGNFSNDQFMPLVLFPFLAGFVGLITLISASASTRPLRPQLGIGAFCGLIAAALVAAWTLQRGAREWLVAPYGFDIALLIIVMAVGVVVVTAMLPRKRPASV